MKSKISVIMPVYNTPVNYLEMSVMSVLGQNNDLFELIIIDDGSTNSDTLTFLSNLDGQKGVIVRHIENNGVSNARNVGIGLSSGEYIVFVDADDCLLDGAIEKIIAATDVSCADIVCFDYCKTYGSTKENVYYSEDSKIFDGAECRQIIRDSLVVEKGLALCWGKAFKRAFLLKNSLYFDISLVLAEDADFAIKCYCNAQKIHYLREILYSYTVSEGSAVRKFRENMPQLYEKGMTKIVDSVKQLNSEEFNKLASNFVLSHLLIIVVNNVFHPENPLNLKQKFVYLKKLCNDECFGKALKDSDYSLFSKARALTLFFIKHNLYLPVFMIAKFRQSTRKD